MDLLSLIDDISNELNKNHSVGILIDLSKSFDTIDHNLQLKMEYCGIRGIVLNWFHNHLSNRKRFVYVNDVDSTLLPLTCGIPQGFILGPLIFIIYINDIVNSSKLAKYIISASKLANYIIITDDTNLLFKQKYLKTLTYIINS